MRQQNVSWTFSRGLTVFLTLLAVVFHTEALINTQQNTVRTGHYGRATLEQHTFGHRRSLLQSFDSNQDIDCDPCASIFEDQEEDLGMDRREAFFSLLGMAWAAGTIPTAILFPESAEAIYGADAKIELPNPIQSMNDRATKQCLVESLGTRECLVYEDPENKLYQGADGRLLLERIEKASISLGQIPTLLEAKKWSQVTGVLTGPMGELVRTMNQLVGLTENTAAAKSKVALVKTDLYAIAAAVDRKQADVALRSYQAATVHLADFVKVLE